MSVLFSLKLEMFALISGSMANDNGANFSYIEVVIRSCVRHLNILHIWSTTPLPSTSGASVPHSCFEDCAVSAELLRASTSNKKKRKRQSRGLFLERSGKLLGPVSHTVSPHKLFGCFSKLPLSSQYISK